MLFCYLLFCHLQGSQVYICDIIMQIRRHKLLACSTNLGSTQSNSCQMQSEMLFCTFQIGTSFLDATAAFQKRSFSFSELRLPSLMAVPIVALSTARRFPGQALKTRSELEILTAAGGVSQDSFISKNSQFFSLWFR